MEMNAVMQDLYRGDPLMRNNSWNPENDFVYAIIASSVDANDNSNANFGAGD